MELTEQEAAEFAAYKASKAAAEAENLKRRQIEQYKQMVDEELAVTIPELLSLSEEIETMKKTVYDNFRTIIELKSELYKVNNGQMTHTFTSSDGKYKILLGYNTIDSYGDTVTEGITMVREYISSLADSPKTEMMVDTIMRLLSRNQNGDLKASRIIQLRRMAEKSGNSRFMEGVKIIEDAYQPSATKHFIRAMVRNEKTNEYMTIPLSITDAPLQD